MKDNFLKMFQVYQPFLPYAVGGLLLFSLQFVLVDISRIIQVSALCHAGRTLNALLQYTAYKLGYKRGSGKGVIPGPLEDTSTLRYVYE